MKKELFLFFAFSIPMSAQIPAPQIPLTGNIGCQGFPCVNSGTLVMTADADRTMTAQETSAMFIKVTSSVSLTSTRNLVAPLGKFNFTIENSTSGGQAIQIVGQSGTGVTIPNGSMMSVWNDGTNFSSLYVSGLADKVSKTDTSPQSMAGGLGSPTMLVGSTLMTSAWQKMGTVFSYTGGTAAEPALLYEGDCHLVSGSNCFKAWFFTSGGSNYAESLTALPGSWTQEYITITGCGAASEVRHYGSTYYYFCANSSGTGIQALTSTDGITWSNAQTILTVGSSGAWDSNLISTSSIDYDGATWHVLYQGNSTSNILWKMGLATGTSLSSLAKFSGNPVITPALWSNGNTGVITGGTALYKDSNGNNWIWPQAAEISSAPTQIVRLKSSDWTSWALAPSIPVIQRTLPTEAHQIADCSSAEANGRVYMLCTNGTSDLTATIGLYIAPMPYEYLVKTDEGANLGYNCSPGFGRAPDAVGFAGNSPCMVDTGVTSYAPNSSSTVVGTNTSGVFPPSWQNTSGTANDSFGSDAGSYIADGATHNSSGSYSTFIGANTRAKENGDTYEIVIGGGSTGAGSNTTMIGTTAQTDVYFGGANATAKLHASGVDSTQNILIRNGQALRLYSGGNASFSSLTFDGTNLIDGYGLAVGGSIVPLNGGTQDIGSSSLFFHSSFLNSLKIGTSGAYATLSMSGSDISSNYGLQAPSFAGAGTPGFSAGAAAGSSPGLPACVSSHICDSVSGTVDMVVGSSTTTGVLLTINTGVTRTSLPNCSGSVYQISDSVYTALPLRITTSATNVVFNVSSAPTASTAYEFTYLCGGL